jgi:hypothetical protein
MSYELNRRPTDLGPQGNIPLPGQLPPVSEHSLTRGEDPDELRISEASAAHRDTPRHIGSAATGPELVAGGGDVQSVPESDIPAASDKPAAAEAAATDTSPAPRTLGNTLHLIEKLREDPNTNQQTVQVIGGVFDAWHKNGIEIERREVRAAGEEETASAQASVTCKFTEQDQKVHLSTDQPGTAEHRALLDERIDHARGSASEAQAAWLDAARSAVHLAATNPDALAEKLAAFPEGGVTSLERYEARLTDHAGQDGSTVTGDWREVSYTTADGATTVAEDKTVRLTRPDGRVYTYDSRLVEITSADGKNYLCSSDQTLNNAPPNDRQLTEFNQALAAATGTSEKGLETLDDL